MNQYNTDPTYQIKIKGHLQEKWSEWFNGRILEMTSSNQGSAQTAMLMSITDQVALRGILNKLWDLNLSLISVTLIEKDLK